MHYNSVVTVYFLMARAQTN